MKTIEIADATGALARHARDANNQPIVLTVNGEPVAALVGLDAMDMESFALSTNPKFLAIIEKSRNRYRKEGGVTSEELRRRLKNKRTKGDADKNTKSRGGRSNRKTTRKGH